MTRQKKTRREAGRIPSTEMTELEKKRGHTSLSKLKPKQRSLFLKSQEHDAKQAKAAKSKNRLKTDPAIVAQSSRELLTQSAETADMAAKEDSND